MNRKNFLKIIPALGAFLIAAKAVKNEPEIIYGENVKLTLSGDPCNFGQINKVFIVKREEIYTPFDDSIFKRKSVWMNGAGYDAQIKAMADELWNINGL